MRLSGSPRGEARRIKLEVQRLDLFEHVGDPAADLLALLAQRHDLTERARALERMLDLALEPDAEPLAPAAGSH